ncbi:chromosome partitioning protein ParA [Candidatus Magnetomorum sp. HK-1]|nr:chromosome partitioning protein ParA [Candidatus Magnetomorum sp. HK-1]
MGHGHILSVINNKGGCGKTTTTVNIADALGKKGKKVLVVDMDSQCNTTSKLNHSKNITESMYDVLNPENQNVDLNSFFYPTNYKNVSLIPNLDITGSLEPALIESSPESFFKLRGILRNYATKNYDFTIIDNPPNMGTFVLCSLYASDFVIVPVKAGSTDSVEGLIKATSLIHEIQKKGNPNLKFLRILINYVDKRTAISKAVIEQIRKTFEKDQIFKTEIPVNTSFERAEAKGESIFQNDATSTGARAFRNLASELISIFGD